MLVESFLTIEKETTAEIIVERSKFIADSFIINDEIISLQKLTAIKKKYSDATHHCYAYVLSPDSNITRHSDDKEPAKTAGLPIVESIKGKKLFNTMVVVTRYFGGVKLGTGGLSRAYQDSANKVLQNSGINNYIFSAFINIKTEYTHILSIEKIISLTGEITDRSFESQVNIFAVCPLSSYCSFKEKITEATGGKSEIKIIKEDYFPYKYQI